MSNIEGDLLELYHERLRTAGKRSADLKFMRDVVRLFRPSVIRRFNWKAGLSLAMYRNHFTTAWRNLQRNRAFSAINISGLMLGLTCSILIGLWINDEQQIDQFHEGLDRLFVVTSVEYSGNEVNGSYDTPGLLGDELPKVFPEVEYATNYGWTGWNTFSAGETKLRIPGNFANNDFFQMFSYPVVAGNKARLLDTPDAIVISRKMASMFFGSPAEALSQTLRFETYKDLKVTGVFEDIGANSSERFEYIINWTVMLERNNWLKDWNNSGPTTFLKLRPGAQSSLLQAKIREFIKAYDKDYSPMERLELGIQPYGEKYLHGLFEGGKLSGGRIEYVNLFKMVAVFVLLIACVNFMNLSTARSVKRAREIGVRKTIGALRTTLVGQFMAEALLYSSIAVGLALVAVTIVLPSFNLLTEKNIPSPLDHAGFWLWVAGVTLLTTFVSGSYPSVVLSSFRPAVVLKKAVNTNSSSGTVRNALVVFQFCLSIVFVVAMIVISRQVDFIYSKNIGYEKNDLIYMRISGDVATNFDAYKQQILQQPGIVDITRMSDRLVEIQNSTGSVEWEGKDPTTRPTFTQSMVGLDFIKTTRAELMDGRDFIDRKTDSASYIINETAARVMGYAEPVGMPLTFWGIKGRIVGVVKDFHFASLHESIRPIVLRMAPERMWGWTVIRVDHAKLPEALKSLEDLHAKFSPETPFTHQFADEEYGALYKSEELVKQLSRYFAGLAIFISCLGLLGSVIFTAEQRRKEMSIRKVMGARVVQIMGLLSGDFLRLIVLSALIGFPLAYIAMTHWLSNFQYRVAIEWWFFPLAGLGAMAVALATVLFHAWKASTASPVESLKSE